MKRIFFKIIAASAFIFATCILNSCTKSSDTAASAQETGYVGFDNRDVTSLPLKIYVDNELKATIGNPMPVYKDCGNLYAHILLSEKQGSHTFAVVDSHGFYADGTFTVSGSGCLNIPLYYSYFGKINYGTSNGSLTIKTSLLGINPISVYVDNIFVGTLTRATAIYFCGENDPGYVISVQLPAGNHTYKAVESGTGTTWSNTKTIVANACTGVNLQ